MANCLVCKIKKMTRITIFGSKGWICYHCKNWWNDAAYKDALTPKRSRIERLINILLNVIRRK